MAPGEECALLYLLNRRKTRWNGGEESSKCFTNTPMYGIDFLFTPECNNAWNWIERSAIMYLHGPYLCHNNMTTLPCSNMNLKNPLCGTTRQIISFSRAYRLHFELEQAISRSIIPTIIYSIPFLIQQFCFRLCDEHFLLTGMSAWL